MLIKAPAAALAIFIISGVALAQPKEVRHAQPGESCQTKYNDCGGWCSKNRPVVSEKLFCDGECTRYHGICEKTGIWSTELGKVETRSLPAK